MSALLLPKKSSRDNLHTGVDRRLDTAGKHALVKSLQKTIVCGSTEIHCEIDLMLLEYKTVRQHDQTRKSANMIKLLEQ